ncbi:MAG: LPS export ABC transporter periplasmic protein LptC [Bdellovibrionaceae bacterium]|nr:LPS export ABC transporter periplasmic protein LptC [Pseudobdellovibrionaceae bacterium]
MNRRNSFILSLLLAILVVEIIIMAPKEVGVPQEEPAAPTVTESGDQMAAHTMQGVSSIGSKGEAKEWELDAVRAVRMNENEDWIIENVKVKFFGESGVTYTVTGNRGDVDVRKNNIRISGNVVTRSTNNYTFKTEALDYDSASRRLVTPHDIEMIGPEEENGTRLRMTGKDLVADMNTNEITVAQNVRAKKSIDNGRLAAISSERAVFSGKTNSARFLGHVIIDVDTLRITGPEARFLYKPDGDTIESITVAGGVKVTDVDKWATSQKVSVHLEEDRFVFSGTPRVVQSGDELIGEEIVFLKGGREVRVSNAKAKIESATQDKAGR